MKNKVVIVTGASSGIGKACAEVFGKQGSRVVITGRNPERLEHTKESLQKQGIDVLAIRADVSKLEDNQRMVSQTLNHYGQIDVLINNAGIAMRATFEELDVSVVEQVMAINFFGAVYATKACLPHIIKTGGSIIGISSIAGYRGLPARTAYSASKFALQGFLECLRTELLYKNVHILIACPSYTSSNIRKAALTKDGSRQGETPRNESSMMSAEVCAKHIYKATVKRKKILTLTTKGKLTVFLNKLFPIWMDKMVFNAIAKEPNSPFTKP